MKNDTTAVHTRTSHTTHNMYGYNREEHFARWITLLSGQAPMKQDAWSTWSFTICAECGPVLKEQLSRSTRCKARVGFCDTVHHVHRYCETKRTNVIGRHVQSALLEWSEWRLSNRSRRDVLELCQQGEKTP